MAKQLFLNIKLNDQSYFENFYFKENALAVHMLKRFFDTNETFIYLWGKNGVGKTHLLQACCHIYQDQNRPMIYLPLKDYQTFSPDILKGLDQVDLVCLDDVDAVSTHPLWAEPLFHCYNTLQQHGKKFIIAANKPPKHLPCILADLKSRYMQGLTLSLHELSDDEKFEAIKMRMKNRGLVISDDVIHFLLYHHDRNLKTLFSTLDQLEDASLQEQRRLTIPFIKNWIKENQPS